jgi:hypothetical protein
MAAKEIGDFCVARGWRFCIIGGLAVQRWGEPRTTLDADLTLLTGFGNEAHYAKVLLAAFCSRIADDPLGFAVRHRVLLLRASNGRDVDVAFGALPFEEEMVRRATVHDFAPGVALPCCSAEDLFVLKAFAARPRDWVDAESIVTRQRVLDTAYILAQLAPLCELKESPENLERARQLLRGGAS